MKLTLLLLLCAASVALLRAEEEVETPNDVETEDESSLDFLHDGTLDDEILGEDEDPGKMNKMRRLSKRGRRRVCGKVFGKCLVKTRGKLGCFKRVRVCKAVYYTCHCIVKGVKKCRRFLRFVRKLKRHMRRKMRHDEDEEDEEDEEDAGIKKKHPLAKKKGLKLKLCLKKVKKAKKGKVCKALKCLKKFFKKKEDIDGEALADAAEDIQEEPIEDEDDEEEEDPGKRGKKRFLKRFFRRCGRRHLRCVLRARRNCFRHALCVRRTKRCFRARIKLLKKMKKRRGRRD